MTCHCKAQIWQPLWPYVDKKLLGNLRAHPITPTRTERAPKAMSLVEFWYYKQPFSGCQTFTHTVYRIVWGSKVVLGTQGIEMWAGVQVISRKILVEKVEINLNRIYLVERLSPCQMNWQETWPELCQDSRLYAQPVLVEPIWLPLPNMMDGHCFGSS